MRDKLGRFAKGFTPWNKGIETGQVPKTAFKKGHPKPKNAYKWKTGEKHPRWKGGRYKNKDGYILILNPTHPFCNGQGYIFEHRLVMEKMLGRFLLLKEVCHHINEIRDDNRPENLRLFSNKSKHLEFHRLNK